MLGAGSVRALGVGSARALGVESARAVAVGFDVDFAAASFRAAHTFVQLQVEFDRTAGVEFEEFEAFEVNSDSAVEALDRDGAVEALDPDSGVEALDRDSAVGALDPDRPSPLSSPTQLGCCCGCLGWSPPGLS